MIKKAVESGPHGSEYARNVVVLGEAEDQLRQLLEPQAGFAVDCSEPMSHSCRTFGVKGLSRFKWRSHRIFCFCIPAKTGMMRDYWVRIFILRWGTSEERRTKGAYRGVLHR